MNKATDTIPDRKIPREWWKGHIGKEYNGLGAVDSSETCFAGNFLASRREVLISADSPEELETKLRAEGWLPTGRR